MDTEVSIKNIYYTLESIQNKVKLLDESDSMKALRFAQRAIAELMDSLSFIKEENELLDDDWNEKKTKSSVYSKQEEEIKYSRPLVDIDELI